MGTTGTIRPGDLSHIYDLLGKEAEGMSGASETKKTDKTDASEKPNGVTYTESETPKTGGAPKGGPQIPPPKPGAKGDSNLEETINKNIKELQDDFQTYRQNIKQYAGLAGTILNAAGFTSEQMMATFFDIFALIALMVETAQKQRNAQREIRYAENENVCKSLERQSELQKQAAQEQFQGQMTAAALQIAMGALSIAGSAVQLGMGFKLPSYGGSGQLTAEGQGFLNKMQGLSGIFQSLSQIGNAVGGLFSAIGTCQAERTRAQVTMEQANQKRAEMALQDAAEGMQQAQSVIDTLVRLWERLAASRLEMMRAVHFS